MKLLASLVVQSNENENNLNFNEKEKMKKKLSKENYSVLYGVDLCFSGSTLVKISQLKLKRS